MFSDLARKRIGQLIPRLASDQEGDVIGAARALHRVLSAEGRDFHDLARAASADPTIVYRTVETRRSRETPDGEWLGKAKYCAARPDALRGKEAEFVADMAVRLQHIADGPTERQAAWLDTIYHRLRRQHGEAA